MLTLLKEYTVGGEDTRSLFRILLLVPSYFTLSEKVSGVENRGVEGRERTYFPLFLPCVRPPV